ncbi:MAG: twin-arginine translocation signal domain-containing protein [Solirubrobacteraceae bacterium]
MVFGSVICGGALLLAAALKVADPTGSRVALQTFSAGFALWPLVALEGLLGVALLSGVAGAGLVAAAVFAVFALAQVVVLARGGGGAPCGCLGARGTVSAGAAVRVALLAVLAAFAGGGHPVLAVAGVLLAALVAFVADRAPGAALDVADEGPAIGAPTTLAPGLNLFTASSCRLCARVKRGLRGFTELDEERDAAAWLAARVPGAPYAVLVGDDGRVRAKGTVNTAAQAQSVAGTSRRTFVGRAAALVALGGIVRPGEAEAYHFCGHIYTTDSCPHPTGLPRIDAKGLPLRAKDGHRVDDLGRLVDKLGRPVDERGELLVDPGGRSLPVATRTRVCDATSKRFRMPMQVDGAWFRCCDGHVRKLVDCCTEGNKRINGDTALTGYCYGGRKVFCVMFFQTKVPC